MLGHGDTKNADRLGHRDIKNAEKIGFGFLRLENQVYWFLSQNSWTCVDRQTQNSWTCVDRQTKNSWTCVDRQTQKSWTFGTQGHLKCRQKKMGERKKERRRRKVGIRSRRPLRLPAA